MLARRKKLRLNYAPRTDYPKHRAFVRRHVCIVPDCCAMTVECCHVRKGLPGNTPSWARPGKDMKPHDAFCYSGCPTHHAEQHRIGEETFARKYGVNLLKEALDLARNSPCDEVRQFVREYKL